MTKPPRNTDPTIDFSADRKTGSHATPHANFATRMASTQHAPRIVPLSPEAAPQLYTLWLDSVRASHTFLTEKDITDIGKEVQPAFRAVSLFGIVVAENALSAPAMTDTNAGTKPHTNKATTKGKETGVTERIAAFMGISGASIEMLFVHPHFFRKGYGKTLVNYALTTHKVFYVDVNEQNPQAAAFYARMGFESIGRDALDSQGRPFPILHLRHSSAMSQKYT